MSLFMRHHESKTDEEYVVELDVLEKKYLQNKHMLVDLFSHRVKLMRAQHDEAMARYEVKLVNDAEKREISGIIRLGARLQDLRDAIELHMGQACAYLNELKRYTQRRQDMRADLKRQIHRVLKQITGDEQRAQQRRKRIIQSWAAGVTR